MTLRMDISERERGHVRVFAIDLPEEAAREFDSDTLNAALGDVRVDPAYVEIFAVEDLADIPLSTYLTMAQGLQEAQIAADATRLDAIKGHVALVLSKAVAGQTLTPQSPLRWIATYTEPDVIPPMDKLTSDAATGAPEPAPTKKQPSDAAIGGRIATYVLLFLFALVAAMVWIAG